MSEFTPGPWMYDDAEEMVKTVARFSNGRRCITNILPQGDDREWNGLLIAAAPAMYEALQEIARGCIERRPGHVDYSENRTKAQIEEIARAALKAATGE